MILIISDPIDGHARLVQQRLKEKGAEAAIFFLGEIPAQSSISAWVEQGRRARIRVRRERKPTEIDLDRVTTVWLRRLAALKPGADLEPEDAQFALDEALAFTLSLGVTLGDRFWVNPMVHALATDRGHGKVSQLELARRIGLEVPRTLASNDPEAAKEFVASCHGGAIYKPFRSPTRSVELDDGRKQWCIVFTTKLDDQAIAKLDGVRHAPCIFQEYVPKKLELRITVIGDKVFACEIHSQVHEGSSVDFRKHYALDKTPYRPHTLPREIEEKILRVHRELGLVFGACDVILTPDGRYVFLEVNQQGQFLWLEEMIGSPLLENFCELLIQGRSDYRCEAAPHAPGPFPALPPLDPEIQAILDQREEGYFEDGESEDEDGEKTT